MKTILKLTNEDVSKNPNSKRVRTFSNEIVQMIDQFQDLWNFPKRFE